MMERNTTRRRRWLLACGSALLLSLGSGMTWASDDEESGGGNLTIDRARWDAEDRRLEAARPAAADRPQATARGYGDRVSAGGAGESSLQPAAGGRSARSWLPPVSRQTSKVRHSQQALTPILGVRAHA